jgi:hypothetical protein
MNLSGDQNEELLQMPGNSTSETERFLAAQGLANSEELAGKAAVRIVMMMKQEAINIAFDDVVSVPPPQSIGGALSMSSVTSTPSGRPIALEPNTPVTHAPVLGAHGRGGAALFWFGDLHPTSSGSVGPGIDLNRTPSTRCATPRQAQRSLVASLLPTRQG